MSMRDLINMVESFGDDTWGYWITAAGEIRRTHDHHADATEVFGNDEFEDDEEDFDSFTSAVHSAIAQGWIRVICPNKVLGANWGPMVTPAARRALRSIIKDHPEVIEYRLNGEPYADERAALRAVGGAR